MSTATNPNETYGMGETIFKSFLNMTKEQLAGLQVKVTYIGEQRKPLPTVVITNSSASDSSDTNCVLSMKVAGLDFGNDELTPLFCEANDGELHSLVKNLTAFPIVSNAGSAAAYDAYLPGKYLALSLYNEIDGEEYKLQTLIGQADAMPLLAAIGRAVATSEDCRKTLFILWRGLGFHIGVLDPDSDGDGASDGRERSWGLDPNNPDCDGDGILDGEAILSETDAMNPFKETAHDPLQTIDEGPFRGSRVVELTTSPDFFHGQASLQLRFTPEGFLPRTDNLVFCQVFRRTAVKADGFKVPILPSLYIEYAGSPELDMLTVDGATVDHKVGELEPYYNGRDPHDFFAGAQDRQHAGMINGAVKPTAMLYKCRTYEEHWRALNPEGIKEVCFDYETAAFCENGDDKGFFLGRAKWSWGKKRSEPVVASIEFAEAVRGAPTGRVIIDANGSSKTIPVFLTGSHGQPSKFYFEVLSCWIKRHKFPWPGQEASFSNGVRLVIPQPVAVDTRIAVEAAEGLHDDDALQQAGFKLGSFAREIRGADAGGNPFPQNYFPFSLPLTVTFTLNDKDYSGSDISRLGVARYDERAGRYSVEDIYVLSRDPDTNSITFCASQFGKFAILEKK